jgi:hypothetical protein
MTNATNAFATTPAWTTNNPLMTVTRLGDIARQIDLDSRAGLEAELSDVVSAARALDLSPVLVSVLAGRDEPTVARHRAFGRLAVAIERALESRGLAGISDDASANPAVISAPRTAATSSAAA